MPPNSCGPQKLFGVAASFKTRRRAFGVLYPGPTAVWVLTLSVFRT
jgi:hypothetical protein